MTDSKSAAAPLHRSPANQPLTRAPAPLPLVLKPLTPDAARAANRTIPIAAGPLQPARPFRLAGDEQTRTRALECLTEAIYYEAGGEDLEGQEAVAQVVLNRVRHPAFPSSVCGVVFQGSTLPTGCQFTFTCDGSLLRDPDRRGWAAAASIARDALSGTVYSPVGLSTHYHADYVLPYWATGLAKDAMVGAHIFYRWPGDWGQQNAFYQRHARREPDPNRLRAAALMAHGTWPGTETSETAVIQAAYDPNLELAGIVALLASPPRPGETKYEKDARLYFGPFAQHVAVQIFQAMRAGNARANPRTASAPLTHASFVVGAPPHTIPPAWEKPPVFPAYVRNFAIQSSFDRFLRGHRAHYAQAATQAERLVTPAVAIWETYTGTSVPGRKMLFVLGPTDNSTLCLAHQLGSTDASIVRWSPAYSSLGAADLFIASGLARGLLIQDPQRRAFEEQIVRAVFARTDALRYGEHAGELAVAREAAQGFDLVPAIAAELKLYEKHRDQFPTLQDFLPTLARGVQPGRRETRGSQENSAESVCETQASA